MPNQLLNANSPYLLQHAENPVEWHEWGPDAIAEARERGVPIFLSIGYSTCYWCHVMERESFEDQSIAEQINQHFVAIKVDREERPDLDDLYMAATQISTGSGGWPLTIFLEPNSLKPFFCGTYFPPQPRSGHPSFSQVLTGLQQAWVDDRTRVLTSADRLADEVKEHLAGVNQPKPVGEKQVSQAAAILLRMHDATHGGFGGAPKFPQPAYLEFLFDAREHADEQTTQAIDAVVRSTLDAMMIGGLHDQVGGGFHRYAVDATWTVPHFEKMLYDNAGLASVFARAARVYDSAWYRRTALRTIEYVRRELTDADGCFFSAQDAEVDGREGLNYLWDPEQVRSVLSPEDAEAAIRFFGLDGQPNFRDPHHPDDPPMHVLRVDQPPEHAPNQQWLPAETLDRISDQLLAHRNERKAPRLDDKVIAAWNGMMIAALARSAVYLDDPQLLERARESAYAVERRLTRENGTLARSGRASQTSSSAVLEDHACLADAWVSIATCSAAFGQDHQEALERSRAHLRLIDAHFRDPQTGRVFDTPEDSDDLFVRATTSYDGATLSGQSIRSGCLVELARLTGSQSDTQEAVQSIFHASGTLAEQPVAMIGMTRALLAALRAGFPVSDVFDNSALTPEPAGMQQAEPPSVEIYASEERLTVDPETPASMSIVLRIPDGHHVIAAEPGMDGLFPFRVSIGGGAGITAYADYPTGEPLHIADLDQSVLVYEGSVEMQIAVECTGEITGRPLLRVAYQLCSDRACQPQKTVELDVAIDLGAPNQEVDQS